MSFGALLFCPVCQMMLRHNREYPAFLQKTIASSPESILMRRKRDSQLRILHPPPSCNSPRQPIYFTGIPEADCKSRWKQFASTSRINMPYRYFKCSLRFQMNCRRQLVTKSLPDGQDVRGTCGIQYHLPAFADGVANVILTRSGAFTI